MYYAAAPMQKVVSAGARPFRAIGRLLRKVLVALGGLRGRTRIVVYGAIGVLLVVLVLVLKPGSEDNEEVRETLERFAAATRDKDYQEICDDVLADELVERVRSAGLPCEVALKVGFDQRRNPRLEVLRIEVNGDRAAARVRTTAVAEVPSTDVLQLAKEDGRWRIASLSGGFTGSASR